MHVFAPMASVAEEIWAGSANFLGASVDGGTFFKVRFWGRLPPKVFSWPQ